MRTFTHGCQRLFLRKRKPTKASYPNVIFLILFTRLTIAVKVSFCLAFIRAAIIARWHQHRQEEKDDNLSRDAEKCKKFGLRNHVKAPEVYQTTGSKPETKAVVLTLPSPKSYEYLIKKKTRSWKNRSRCSQNIVRKITTMQKRILVHSLKQEWIAS